MSFLSIANKLFFLGFLTLNSCYYRIPENSEGDHILTEKVNYKFTEKPSKEDLTKIDTTTYYIQVFEGRYYNEDERKNPQILIFHNDGFFEDSSILLRQSKRSYDKESILYGGKYRITEDIIELEEFFPSKGGYTNYFCRNISKGKIIGNKIVFDKKTSLLAVYEKVIP